MLRLLLIAEQYGLLYLLPPTKTCQGLAFNDVGSREAMTKNRYVDPERAAFEEFKLLSRDEPVDMLNLVRFREVAVYPPDHPHAGERMTGAEAYRHYSRSSAPIFSRVGGTILWSAIPRLVLIGPTDEQWDAAFVARYPNASAFLEMITDEEYRIAVVHRQAAVETSRLIRTCPREGSGSAFG
jgi:uncharacterized protein (DUF1330 family)